jgi:hypothetical protein
LGRNKKLSPCLGTLDLQRQEVKSVDEMNYDERCRRLQSAAAEELDSSVFFG